ncbi:MAG: hypothetical protein AVDCRST_MAG53-1674 [uncultured Solirubrobacteraceae bacterium]|uniref:Uncharacterized protein n=1 Tax=uncultured Solirubrobacteraceae bacterium TaxID=1162706 RepID=A0A6J4SJ84_9ACTN|nr:MAG: hypothetical protein AVDCRST_MAG53-1674 [uncultured Solirubrobacteraceae bacterium]
MSDSTDPVPPARRFGWHLTPPDPLPIRTGSAAEIVRRQPSTRTADRRDHLVESII